MKIKGITHTGIIVKNLEAEMIPFLRDWMGLKQLSQPQAPAYDADEARAVGVPGAIVRSAMFEVAPGQLLEILEYVEPESPVESPLPQNAVGSHHVCFTVDNIQKWRKRLEAAGHTCYSEPQLNRGGLHKGSWWMYFEGPGGIVFELMEMPEGPGSP